MRCVLLWYHVLESANFERKLKLQESVNLVLPPTEIEFDVEAPSLLSRQPVTEAKMILILLTECIVSTPCFGGCYSIIRKARSSLCETSGKGNLI